MPYHDRFSENPYLCRQSARLEGAEQLMDTEQDVKVWKS
jgi:hypothetical protein